MSSHNILSKVDKSLAPTPVGVMVSKKAKFNWSTLGKPGVFQFISKRQLNIDGRYQRDAVSTNKVIEIAKFWDWLLVGTIAVIVREDGSYWVFDGGHRTRASFYRDDVDLLPCMVHSINDVTDEAKAFVARNTMVSNVNSFARYKASVCAGEPNAAATAALLQELGLTVCTGGGESKNQLMAIGAVQSMVAKNAVLAKRVLEFLLMIDGDKSLSAVLLKALFCLCDRMQGRCDIIGDFGDKLASYGIGGLEAKIKQFSIETGRSNTVVHAKALLDLVNTKKRNRIEW